MEVTVATVDRQLAKGRFDAAVLPSATGQIEVLPQHAPLITQLDTGVMRLKSSQGEQSFVLHGGFALVENDNLRIVVEVAEKKEEIDSSKAKAELATATAQLSQLGQSPEQIKQCRQQVKLNQARLQIAG